MRPTSLLRRLIVAAVLLTAGSTAHAEAPDAVMAQFFSIWDDNARVTPDRVRELYGEHVVYYGESLTNAQVYANKQAFVRRWPDRHYAVVPDSVRKGCDRDQTRCFVTVTLAYQTASAARGATARGLTRVSLTLERENGTLRIMREAGHPVSSR